MVDTDEALRVIRGDVGEAAHEKPKPVQSYEHLKQDRTGFTPLFRSSAGIDYETAIDNMTGDMIIRAVQDVYAILEANQEEFTANDGYSADKSIRRVGRIPAILRNKVLVETSGQVDLWRPDTDQKYYKRFMNDADYKKLRTAPGRI